MIAFRSIYILINRNECYIDRIRGRRRGQNNKQTANKRLQTKWIRNDGLLFPPDGPICTRNV